MNYCQVLRIAFIVFFSALSLCARAQNPAETFVYNAKGLTYVPALKKPAVIYQGKLFVGRRQLTNLFSHINNAELNGYLKKYKSNKTASAIIRIGGAGLSVYSLLDWRNSDRRFNWYTFGGGLLLGGLSGYFDAKGDQHLRNAAVVFDRAMSTAVMVPPQTCFTIAIPFSE